MRTWVAAIVVVGMGSGCKYGPYEFTCTDDASCGVGGKCEPGFNLCSFANPNCPGGRAFGSFGGADSGQCVGSEPLPDAGRPDGPPPDARVCYGTDLVSVCLAAPPTTPLMISAPMTIDTTISSLCAPTVSGGASYCVVAATDITITAKLRSTGAKPLVLIASGAITTSATGMIDVASHRSQTPETGAGADPVTCELGTPPANGGSGGGAGGSFIGLGGSGGDGEGTAGGTPGNTAAPTALRGGCPGQDGQALNAGDEGVGGHGGGAVFLIAGTKIDIQGDIDAAGEGGAGGQPSKAGAGGGGAGGMIGFDAPMITATSLILANGGGGGEGSSAVAGNPGSDPSAILAAAGGSGASGTGGDGGAGSAGAAAGPGALGQSTGGGGGGGGGGGAGLIKAPAGASLGTNVSPAPMP